MPISNDNQDYNNKENLKENEGKEASKNSGASNQKQSSSPESENEFTSDNLKGKKIDADVEKETDRPADI